MIKPEYYIIGQHGCLNTKLVDRDGYRCWGFTCTRKIQTWKNKAKVKEWLNRALLEDPTARIVTVN